MPKYVIERDIPGVGNHAVDLKAASKKSCGVLRELGPSVQWVHSYVTLDKMYCVYYAPDESLIVAHARLTGLPLDRVAAVRRLLDPTNYQ